MSRTHSATVIRRLRAHKLVPAVPVRLARYSRNASSRPGAVSWWAVDGTGVRLGVESAHTVEELARARVWACVETGGVTRVMPGEARDE